ncbi:MAG: cell division protein FtsK [Magnetococcales bacterium]|nr:cell division protein FtsK [Magnetococcales bacterium]
MSHTFGTWGSLVLLIPLGLLSLMIFTRFSMVGALQSFSRTDQDRPRERGDSAAKRTEDKPPKPGLLVRGVGLTGKVLMGGVGAVVLTGGVLLRAVKWFSMSSPRVPPPSRTSNRHLQEGDEAPLEEEITVLPIPPRAPAAAVVTRDSSPPPLDAPLPRLDTRQEPAWDDVVAPEHDPDDLFVSPQEAVDQPRFSSAREAVDPPRPVPEREVPPPRPTKAPEPLIPKDPPPPQPEPAQGLEKELIIDPEDWSPLPDARAAEPESGKAFISERPPAVPERPPAVESRFADREEPAPIISSLPQPDPIMPSVRENLDLSDDQVLPVAPMIVPVSKNDAPTPSIAHPARMAMELTAAEPEDWHTESQASGLTANIIANIVRAGGTPLPNRKTPAVPVDDFPMEPTDPPPEPVASAPFYGNLGDELLPTQVARIKAPSRIPVQEERQEPVWDFDSEREAPKPAIVLPAEAFAHTTPHAIPTPAAPAAGPEPWSKPVLLKADDHRAASFDFDPEDGAAKSDTPFAPEPEMDLTPSAAPATPDAPEDDEPDAAYSGDVPLPPLDLLTRPPARPVGANREVLERKSRLIEQKLADFKVKGQVIDARPGPVVTTFELDPAPGLKASKVIGLADDLARSISALSVRVVGNIPGKSVIGIEVPNDKRETVYLREILESQVIAPESPPLTVALGADINGYPVVADLAKMPHLLVAGTTGSGKSVALNAMICTILFRCRPDQVRLLMVDPKMLELSIYEGIPHLLAPVVTDVKKAAMLLKWAVAEMEERYRLMSELSVRSLAGFNRRIEQCLQEGAPPPTRRVKVGFDPETGQPVERDEPVPLEKKPLILIVVDELADLMMQVGKEVEPAIARLAQMARAAGIHLILATQRPSVDVITGLIKANFPTRLAFQVSSRIDSRTILDSMGAERLLGMGDGLYMPPGTSHLQRIHAPFVADEEVHALVKFLRGTGTPAYNGAIFAAPAENGDEEEEGFGGGFGDGLGDVLAGNEYDEIYDQAVNAVLHARKVSVSMVQRHFKIGYNRAARIVERMEQDGLVSEATPQGKREVLVPQRPE